MAEPLHELSLTRLIAALWPYLTLLFLVWTDRQRNHDEVLPPRL